MSNNIEDEIVKFIAEQNRPLRDITIEDRDKAVIRILQHHETPGQMENVWNCLTKFYETTKAMGSPMEQEAKEAAVFINKLRATYEVSND